ncbi:MAG: gliding motility-associated C-terminal domain-containing protein, partial [Saprospiraceae bacterium]|nr:gliding motility-associated C-terminal domain-containing protein [Saprospiraceae bacterium]
ATLTVSGNYPTPPQWSNTATGPTITANTAGLYTVTVTDANGCTATATQTIAPGGPAPTPQISGSTALCSGSATLTVSGSYPTPPQWSNNATGLTITANTAGLYTVTVTAANGCTATATQTITPGGPAPTPQITGNLMPCTGSSTVLSAGAYSAYTWTGNQSGPTLTVNAQGTYTVTVTDLNGCTGTDQVQVDFLPAPNPTTTQTPDYCNQTNGTVQLNVGGPGPFGFLWSTGSSSQNLTNISAGTYTVTVTGQGGCSATATAIVAAVAGPSVSPTATPASCGQTDGAVALGISGGTPNFTFLWNTGATAQNITAVPAGTYTVTVTDAAGCSQTTTTNVPGPPALATGIVEEDCGGGDAVYVVRFPISGGTPPYMLVSGAGTITGNQFESQPIFSGVNYSFSISDAAGCPAVVVNGIHSCTCVTDAGTMDSAPLVVCGNDAEMAQYFPGQPLPSSAVLRFALHLGSGNQLQNVLAWNTSPEFGFISNGMVYGATYYISAIAGQDDGFGNVNLADPCLDVSVGTPVRFFPTYNSSVPAVICKGETYTVGTESFDSTGMYTVPLQSIHGCDSVIVLNLEVRDPKVLISKDTTICAGNPVTLTAQSSGCNGCKYSWSVPGAGNSIQLSPASSEVYHITVTDNQGCTATASASVQVEPDKVINISAVICKGGAFKVGAQSFTKAGDYTVHLNSVAGCDSTVNLLLEVMEAQALIAVGDTVFYPPGQGISERVFDVAANDSLFGAAWRIRITQQPQAGQADSTDDGRRLRYRLLNTAFRGIDVLEYELCDADCQGPCSRARVWVVVQDDIENVADSLVNTITPNGDGFNDVFDPLQEYLDQQYIVPVKQATLSIFNRWGERVFHTDGNYEPWDGSTGNGGRKVPQGAYYYVLQLDVGEKIVVRGTVHVFGTE